MMKSGYTISFGDTEHKIARWRITRKRVHMYDVETLSTEALKDLSKDIGKAVACFSAGNIYADIGTFTDIGKEATYAHIKANIDNMGLFNEEYLIAFKKLEDIDKFRARFSYLAVSKRDVNKVNLLDDKTTSLKILCPIEVALLSAVARVDKRPAVIVYEDAGYIRIVGSREDTMFFVKAISKKDSFEPVNSAKAAIEETLAFMESEYSESVGNIYKVGSVDIPIESSRTVVSLGLPEVDGLSQEDILSNAELIGNIRSSTYDFSPKSFQETRTFKSISAYSLGLSLSMIFLSIIFFGYSIVNVHTARIYKSRADIAYEQYENKLSATEDKYNAFVKGDNISTAQGSPARLVNDFKNEPKLYNILTDIINAVPQDVVIKKIYVTRPQIKTQPQTRVINKEDKPHYSTGTKSFAVGIEGSVYGSYTQSKEVFLSFIYAIDRIYPGGKADFHYGKAKADFTIGFEARK